MLFLDHTNEFTLMTANQTRWTLTTANRMLRNCQEDLRFCYDIRGKLFNKYDPCYAVVLHGHILLSYLCVISSVTCFS